MCSRIPVPLAIGHGAIFLRFLGEQSLVSGKNADTGLSHRGRDFRQRGGYAQAEGEDQKNNAHFKTFLVEAPMLAASAQKPVVCVDSEAAL